MRGISVYPQGHRGTGTRSAGCLAGLKSGDFPSWKVPGLAFLLQGSQDVAVGCRAPPSLRCPTCWNWGCCRKRDLFRAAGIKASFLLIPLFVALATLKSGITPSTFLPAGAAGARRPEN